MPEMHGLVLSVEPELHLAGVDLSSHRRALLFERVGAVPIVRTFSKDIGLNDPIKGFGRKILGINAHVASSPLANRMIPSG